VLSGLRLDYTGGAALTATGNGVTNPVIVQISGGTDVVIEGVTIANGVNDGIRSSGALLVSHVDIDNNNNRGINASAQNQAQTHVWSSRITNNGNEGVLALNGPFEMLRSVVAGNSGGGINARGGAISIISSIISGNGGTGTSVGGLYFQSLNGNSPTLEFDTIAYNQTKATSSSPGLQADNTAAVAISNSIVGNNTEQNVTDPPQICAACTASYTLFSGTAPIGTGNITGAPGFVSASDYHITSASAARGMADPNENIHYDVDGETRPQGSPDMGADEIP
jgi:hypothetical protein